ncbi:Predicted PurR-regulated permease PerM [Pseudobutyrivibrio sp. UC1225]|uniref:AI-2E family transporter n=1 Tax=Pseudobutyrivibrio sp. UC1225 TaxID=1798185 RepID=UPI0008E5737E|nr:AI-2E family transporter [Pseudobutyrivibrio sp. UC1225]SFN71633.1 Predicted PurR-regulated permease PerM [Pseudobutyrivibrio sp. UC1225]
MPEDRYELEEKLRRKKMRGYVYAAFIIIIFYFLLKNSRSVSLAIDHLLAVIQPIFMGFAMAFLMNPIMTFLEIWLDKPFKKIWKNQQTAERASRLVSSIISLVILMGVVIYIIATVMPNLINTIVYLANHIDYQAAAVLDYCNYVTKGRFEDALMQAKQYKIGDLMEEGLNLLEEYIDYDESKMMTTITSSVLSIGKIFINLIIGAFVSIYVLLSKEVFKGQAKKLICGIFRPDYANIILEISRKSGDIFYGFIIGKMIDSIIIGITCYIGCLFMKMPYPILVSVIIGVTNIVPVFGPYIGAIPTVLIIFLTEPKKGIYFLIFILILQQIDGNLIGPKILGDSTGISSFWVVFAVVLGGGYFGFWGMVIAVPIVAIIYYITGKLARFLVIKRGFPEETEEYISLDHIDTENNVLVPYSQFHDQEKKARRRRFKIRKKSTK